MGGGGGGGGGVKVGTKIQENTCLDVVILYKNIGMCMFACNFSCFQYLYPEPPMTHYIIIYCIM